MRYLLCSLLCMVIFVGCFARTDPSYEEMCGGAVRVYNTASISLSEDMFCSVFTSTTRAVKNRGFSVDTLDAVVAADLSVHFLSRGEGDPRGMYTTHNDICIYPQADTDWGLCMETYYILGHELLHFLAEKSLGESYVGRGHDIPELFAQGALDAGMSIYVSAEWNIYVDVDEMCQ